MIHKNYTNIETQSRAQKLYLMVYSSIKNGGKLPKKSISKSRLEYYTRKLTASGYIRKIGYGTWEIIKEFQPKTSITFAQKSILLPPPQLKKVILVSAIRSHAFRFKIKLPNIDNWNKREQYLKLNNIPYKNRKITSLGQQIYINGHKVWLTDKSIIIFASKDYITTSATDGKSYAIDDMLQIIHKIEALLKVSFKINKRYEFRVTNEHHAKLRDALASQYRRDGKKLSVYDAQGLWLWIDYSDGIDELETGNRPDASYIMDNKIVTFFNELKELDDFTPKSVMKILGNISLNQDALAKSNGKLTEGIMAISNLLNPSASFPPDKPDKNKKIPEYIN